MYLCVGSKNKSVQKYGGDSTQAESPVAHLFFYKKKWRITFD
jgi:hypothetical protein